MKAGTLGLYNRSLLQLMIQFVYSLGNVLGSEEGKSLSKSRVRVILLWAYEAQQVERAVSVGSLSEGR